MAKFKSGQTGNPKGRPIGSKAKASALRQRFVAEFEALAAVVLNEAKGGDMQAARMCLDRCLPPLRAVDAPVILEIDKTAPLLEQSRQVLAAGLDGRLPVAQAVQMAGALSALAEKSEILDRLAKIEAALNIGAGQ